MLTASLTARVMEIIPGIRAIGIHAGQNNLAGAQILDFSRPVDSFQTGRNPAAVDLHFPHFLAVTNYTFGINIHDNALSAKVTKARRTNSGSRTAEELIETLSAPAFKSARMSSRSQFPAANVHRVEQTSAVRERV